MTVPVAVLEASASWPVVVPATPMVSAGETQVRLAEPPSEVALLNCTCVLEPPAEPVPAAQDDQIGSELVP